MTDVIEGVYEEELHVYSITQNIGGHEHKLNVDTPNRRVSLQGFFKTDEDGDSLSKEQLRNKVGDFLYYGIGAAQDSSLMINRDRKMYEEVKLEELASCGRIMFDLRQMLDIADNLVIEGAGE